MKKIRSIILAALCWISPIAAGLAQQSAPNWSYGYTPTPAEWNHWFAVKSDWPGSASCLLTGCTFTGPVFTAPSAALGAGFNLGQGVAPSSPNNGDMWITSAGVFVRFNGATTALGINSCSPSTAGSVCIWNGSSWTVFAGNNSGTQFFQENAAGVPSWVTITGTGTVTNIVCDGVTITTTGTCPPPYGMKNCALAASVVSNNLTINLNTASGATPSAASPCNIYFRNSTLNTGSWTQVTTTAAVSFTANSGSTFGVLNTAASCSAAASCPFRLWVVGINTGAGLAIGVVALSNASGVLALNESNLISSTACAACATATALGTIYSTAAQATKPFIILGYLEWSTGLTTAGAYASGPTTIQTMGAGVRKPGDILQDIVVTTNVSGNTANNSGTLTALTSTPSISITPTSTINLIKAHAVGTVFPGSSSVCQVQWARGTTLIGTSGTFASNTVMALALDALDTPGAVSVQTYSFYGRVYTAVTCIFPIGTNAGITPAAGATLEVIEIMG